MVGLYCAVSGCGNNLARCRIVGSSITFHRFPLDANLREIWTDFCDRGENWKKQNVFICSEHFTPSDFRCNPMEPGKKRTQLFKGAVPSRIPPASAVRCCAVGCFDPVPAIVVRRFPTDVTRRTQLLGNTRRKQGLPVQDCFPCEEHFELKQFLKDEVKRLISEKDESSENIVILEVSTVDGKQNSSILIEPPSKKRKSEFHPKTNRTTVELEGKGTIECGETSTKEIVEELKVNEGRSEIALPAAGSNTDPLPVLVKNGDSSELMFLYHPSNLPREPRSFSKSDSHPDLLQIEKLNASTNFENMSYSSTKEKNDHLLIDRMHKRIQELKDKIVSQRDLHKQKMGTLENKYSNKVKELSSRLKELKAEVCSYHKVHKNITSRGLSKPVTHAQKQSQTISREVQQILERSFTTNQIKKIINESEPVRWSNSELLTAFTLKQMSQEAYTFVRNHLKYPLPSLKYLGRWLSKIENKGIASENQVSQSVQENDEMEMLVAESAKPEDTVDEIVFDGPSSTAEGFESESGEGLNEDERPNCQEILIISNPEHIDSNAEYSSQDRQTENNFEVYYAVHSKEDSSDPKLFVLEAQNEETLEKLQINNVTSLSESTSSFDGDTA